MRGHSAIIFYMSDEIISYKELEENEGFRVQHGMNYRIKNKPYSIFLMDLDEKRQKYKDKIVDGGRAVIYEGHNIRKDLLKDGQKAEEV